MIQEVRGVRGAGEGSKVAHVKVPPQGLDALIVRGAGEGSKDLHVQYPPQRPYALLDLWAKSSRSPIKLV